MSTERALQLQKEFEDAFETAYISGGYVSGFDSKEAAKQAAIKHLEMLIAYLEKIIIGLSESSNVRTFILLELKDYQQFVKEVELIEVDGL